MSNDLFSLNQQVGHCVNSIFNQLLNHYQNPQNIQTMTEQKLFQIQECMNEQQQVKPYHKSSGEWVWADQDQFQNHYDKQIDDDHKIDALTADNFQLRRVKSLRIQQEDKVTMFLKKDSFVQIEIDNISQEKQEQQRFFHSQNKKQKNANKSQSLSPRKCKSKKIDKFKQFKLV